MLEELFTWKGFIILCLIISAFAVFVIFCFAALLYVLARVFREKIMDGLEWVALPDPDSIEQNYQKFCQEHPSANPAHRNLEEDIKAVIREHSHRAGLIGAAIGLGGFATEGLLGFAVDAGMVLRTQANMIFLLAYMHGYRGELSEEDRLKLVLALSGSNQVAQYALNWIAKMFLTSVPVVGAIPGYVINWMVLKSTGAAAVQYFGGKLNMPELKELGAKWLRGTRNIVTHTTEGIRTGHLGAATETMRRVGQQLAERVQQDYRQPPPAQTVNRASAPLPAMQPVPAPRVTTTIICGYCNRPTSAEGHFCNHCGKPPQAAPPPVMQAPRQVAAVMCGYCNTPTDAAGKFCNHCGNPRVPVAPAPVRQPARLDDEFDVMAELNKQRR